jgi:pimeloyl-ACP methyl ester carboxylesterase
MPHLRCEIEQGLATVVLNNPPQNRLSPRMAVVDAVSRSTVIVGHSMGTQVAELVTPMRPREIAGLVLLPLGGLAVSEGAATALGKSGGNPEAQRELRIKFSSHLTAADPDHAVEVGAKVRPETSAALFFRRRR